ncbi:MULTISPECIES: tetratricopeptide repeat protein [Streptomyces]|uniref:Tetratricopeptide repeat protein n=1 Tax=Streptomyces galilaeus TaxID=33899 RepID=A0ABW9IYZ5_STRGJ
MTGLGAALRQVRRFNDAITAYTQAADIFRELDDRHGEGATLNNLGNGLQHVRRFNDAITAHTQAASIYRKFGDRHGEGTALNNLGIAQRELRRSRGLLALWRRITRRRDEPARERIRL